ncbi:MAG TPA: hypothetical protein VG165_15715 [Solirubrobacteraceae bacterium]|jgi:hypothetical protein|nr:hypothetical protein [Solirubrobacteraceae bacterium]
MLLKPLAAVVGAIVGMLLLSMIVLNVYHSPMPHNLPVAIVGSGPVVAGLVKKLDASPQLAVRQVANGPAARILIEQRKIYGAYAPLKKTGEVLVASAASQPVAGVIPQIFAPVSQQLGITPVVKDIAPLPTADSAGASSYFLTLVALIFAGLAGWFLESKLPSIRRGLGTTLARILLIAVGGILAGLVMAEYANAIGIFKGHLLDTTLALALTFFAVTTIASVYTSVLGGPAGLGLGLSVFVLIGVLVASGESSAPQFLPSAWRVIGGLLPPRSTVELIKNYAYFGGRATTTPLIVLGCYSGLGVLMMLALSPFRRLSR